MVTVQYRVKFGKSDEAVLGPDDAAVVLSCGPEDAITDPTVAYMQGRLKVSGSSGALFEILANGQAAKALSGLATRKS